MYTCYNQSFKILATFYSWAGWFESYQVENRRRHIFAWCGSHGIYRFMMVVIKMSELKKNCETIVYKLSWYNHFVQKIFIAIKDMHLKQIKEIVRLPLQHVSKPVGIVCAKWKEPTKDRIEGDGRLSRNMLLRMQTVIFLMIYARQCGNVL